MCGTAKTISSTDGKYGEDVGRSFAGKGIKMTSEEIEKIVTNHADRQGSIIVILEDIQNKFRYLPEEALRIVARQTGRSLVDIYGVATFYKAFSLKPRGKHLISV